jgi:hypothetical protein
MKATVKSIGGLVLALLVCSAPSTADALGFGIVITGGGHSHHGRNAFRLGYERGYEDGFAHGLRDSRRHDSYDFRDAREYRRGDRGYHSGCGPRFDYVNGYRGGYEEGYRRAFRTHWRARHQHNGRGGWCYQRHDRCRDCDYDRGARLDERERGRDDYRRDERWRDEPRCDPRRERCDGDDHDHDRDDDWKRR